MDKKTLTDPQYLGKRSHPLLISAAIAVIVFSLLGSAAILGWLPAAHPEKEESALQTSKRSDNKVSDKTPYGGCLNCGTISAINTVQIKGEASGIGAVAGGATGALVGTQVGKGHGKTAMTVVGAVGGAYAGNEIEKHVKAQTVYRITVQMDDGSYRTVSDPNNDHVVGDKVRIVNGHLLNRV